MSVYLRPCTRCKAKSAGHGDRRRKGCPDCKWLAYSPPSLGRKGLGTFATRAEAEAAEREARVNAERGIGPISRKVKLADIVERFLGHADATLQPKTAKRYREMWTQHGKPTLGNRLVAKLNAHAFTSLYEEKATKPHFKDGSAL